MRRWANPPVLPPRLWSHRHQILRLVLWANIPPASVLVLLHRQDQESLFLVSLVAGLALLATLGRGTRTLRATLVSVGLMACAGLAAFASTGPQRFAYFVVMTASIALYRSWAVLAVACLVGIGEELVLGSPEVASVGALFMLIVGSGALIAWSMDVRQYQLEEGPDETQAANRLREAIQHGELILHYQPKFDLRTRRIVGVEALVRWSPPGQELVFPDAFIGVAERAGIMKPLTFAVLDLALRQYRAWDDRGLTLPMAINLTASILDDKDFPIQLGMALEARFVSPAGIALELTESVVMQDRPFLRPKNEHRRWGSHHRASEYRACPQVREAGRRRRRRGHDHPPPARGDGLRPGAGVSHQPAAPRRASRRVARELGATGDAGSLGINDDSIDGNRASPQRAQVWPKL